MNSYDEVKLSVVRSLNSQILNNAFQKLYDNDTQIAPKYDYTPNIWENKWFNDEVIPGYHKGYCTWKYVYNDVTSFLDRYGDIIYNYAQDNDMLKDYLDKRWSETTGMPAESRAFWSKKYFNVISGYSKESSTSMTMNSKIRYLKFVFNKDQWSSDSSKWIEIGKLKFTDNVNYLPYPAKVFYTIENINKDSAINIDNILRGKMIGLQRLSTDKTTSFTIDLGKPYFILKQYPYLNITMSSSENKRPVGFTLYGSVDGDEFVQIFQEKNIERAITKQKSLNLSDKIKVWNESKYVQYLDPLFEYGEFNGASRTIQLFISTKDNNKDFLSNSNSWENVILSDANEYNNFISTEVDLLFADHIKNYHLDGILSNRAEVDDLLLSRDLSNFSLNLIPTQLKVREHDQYMNADGFDYVVDFKIRSKRTEAMSSGKYHYHLYQWYRLWNSGYLEHGGTIQCPKPAIDIDPSKFENYYISVDLSWGGLSATYNYDQTTGYPYGDVFQRYYYGDENGNKDCRVIEELKDDNESLKGSRYQISLTPVQFSYTQDCDVHTGKFKDISYLDDRDYPKEPISNKVSSYITTEIHHIKNDSFCFTKSNTDCLSSNNKMQLYTYRTCGFTTRVIKV